MNNKSVFNISIVEIMLILMFMFISISVYQITYKNNQITELTQIVETERETIEDIVNKDCPKLENKIDDLINLEKCKKENIALKNENKGINFIANKISKDIKNADMRKYSKEYENLKNEKPKLNAQIDNLKNNQLTINVLTQLNQQDQPLHQQIISIEEKIKDNYKNRMILVNKLKKLRTNDKVKYILSRLDKNDAPIHEQITAIGKELNQLNQNRLGKSYNTNTNYVLDNLKQNNNPIDQQIQALKQSLENKNLLREIENLKRQLANNLNTRNQTLDIKDINKALNNLQNIKNNPSETYHKNTKHVLENIGANNMPINEQINKLENTLNADSKLKKQITDNIKANDNILNTNNIAKALNNLNDMKNNHTNTYTPNSKDILKKIDMSNKPLNEQINTLKNKLDLDRQLKEKLANNLKAKNDNLDTNNLKKALDNLQKIKNKDTNTYDPGTNDILKKLDINNKNLNEQINTLKNKLDLVKQLKEKLANNLKAKNDNLDTNNLKKALDNLQKIKNKDTNTYDPGTNNILKKLDINNKNLNEQINTLKNKLDVEKQLKEKLANNLKAKNNNLNTNKLKTQIKELEKLVDNNSLLNNPKLDKKSIQEALKDLNNLKNANKTYMDELKNALNIIKEIEKIKNKLSNKTDTKPILNKKIENAIKYLEDKTKNPNLKADKDIQTILQKFNIKGDRPSNKQLSNLYLNLYSIPSNNINVSELNFILKRLNNLKNLNDRLNYVNNFLANASNTSIHTNRLTDERGDIIIGKDGKDGKDGKEIYSKKEIETLKNKIKYLQKKIAKSGVTHLPCFIDNDGSSIFLFILYLRDNNIHVELGKHESVKELSKNLPNMDKLVGKTMSLNKFMKLTKPIFEQSVQDECRQFVFFKDETISKKEYKRKTLSIQHHFYKYIEHTW